MKRSISTIALVAMTVIASRCPAQYRWPITIAGLYGVLVDIWKPQIVAYDRNVLRLKSVIAVSDVEEMEPVFGMIWMTARVKLDSVDGWIEFQTIRIDYVTMPEDPDRRDLAVVERDLSANIGALKTLPMADLAAFNKATPERAAVEGLADSTGLQTIDSLENAALSAQVPQIVRVKPFARTEVIYTGSPNFEEIPGTRL